MNIESPAVKLKDFIPWLRSQPADREFSYCDTDNCMLCAFLRETQGIENPSVGCYTWRLRGEPDECLRRIPEELSLALRRNCWKLTCGNVLAHLERNK